MLKVNNRIWLFKISQSLKVNYLGYLLKALFVKLSSSQNSLCKCPFSAQTCTKRLLLQLFFGCVTRSSYTTTLFAIRPVSFI